MFLLCFGRHVYAIGHKCLNGLGAKARAIFTQLLWQEGFLAGIYRLCNFLWSDTEKKKRQLLCKSRLSTLYTRKKKQYFERISEDFGKRNDNVYLDTLLIFDLWYQSKLLCQQRFQLATLAVKVSRPRLPPTQQFSLLRSRRSFVEYTGKTFDMTNKHHILSSIDEEICNSKICTWASWSWNLHVLENN